MHEIDDILPDAEKEQFRKLQSERNPPARLEYQTVDALINAGMIKPSVQARRLRLLHGFSFAGASVLLLFAGAAVGAWWQSKKSAENISPQFMLVLRSDSHQDLGEMDHSRAVEYGQWARKISSQGIQISGEKLKNETHTLNVIDGRTFTNVTSAEKAQNSFGGYFLISARDYQQASEIAAECPHLKYGGTIEVRQIDK